MRRGRAANSRTGAVAVVVVVVCGLVVVVVVGWAGRWAVGGGTRLFVSFKGPRTKCFLGESGSRQVSRRWSSARN